jgi:multisubunit Na+/H+ antiporter MnhE subunit
MSQPTSSSAPARAGRGARSRLIFGFAWWAILAALWLLLVESLAPAELIVGGLAAAIAASVAEAVREQGYMRFSPSLVWLRHGPRIAWQILADCWILAVALVRHVGGRPARGLIIRVPIRYGDDSGRAAARRALLNFGISITPNSYVIDLDGEAATAVIHQLVPGQLDPLLADDAPTSDPDTRPVEGER